ncbi:MAG: hypothetical protein NHB14_05860 [Desulfosporosinus sp.]|nr:hypothetical protein [Desulfosporosinus sp.]
MELKCKSILFDKRINAWNVLLHMKMNEYIEIANFILNNNPFQRKKIRNSNKVYSLLKKDLISGCVIPPIVLALINDKQVELHSEDDVEKYFLSMTDVEFRKFIILDGLQRTNIILSIYEDMNQPNLFPRLEDNKAFYENDIRIEIYIGVSRIGILYRMLTLNTGQTHMSLRHQIEIMYSDYLELNNIPDIDIIKEGEDAIDNGFGKYIFRDLVDGLNSYMTRNEFPLKRNDVLEKMEGLEELSKEGLNKDLFSKFIISYDHFIRRLDHLMNDFEFDNEEIEDKFVEMSEKFNIEEIEKHYFNINMYFNKSVSMTGFGAAVGKLIDTEAITEYDEIDSIIDSIRLKDYISILNLHFILLNIKNEAKNIGTEHRRYYYCLFRELFNKNSDSYQDFDKAISSAFKIYNTFKM